MEPTGSAPNARIAAALVKAQKQFGAVTKSKSATIQSSRGNYEYKYNDLASVLDAVMGPLNDQGIALMQVVEMVPAGVKVMTVLLHESGEMLRSVGTVMPLGATATPQAVGSAITYCKRYDLQAFLGVPSEDDDAERATKDAQATLEQKAVAALEDLAAAATDGAGAVQGKMEELEKATPGLTDYLRANKRPEIASIGKAAKNAAASKEAVGRAENVQ